MFSFFSDQLKSTTNPMQSLFASNAKTFESLAQQNTELWTGMLSDGVKYMEKVSVQPQIETILAANSEYAASVRERWVSSSRMAFQTLTSLRTENTETVTQSAEKTVESVKDETSDVVSKTNDVASKVTKSVEAAAKSADEVKQQTTSTSKAVAQSAKQATDATVQASEKNTQALTKAADKATSGSNETMQGSEVPANKTATRTRKATAAPKSGPAKKDSDEKSPS